MIDQQERPILHDHTQHEHCLPQSGIVIPATAIAVLCCLFLGVAWYVSSGRALPFDLSAHQRVRSFGNPPLTAFMHVGPFLGTITVVIAPITALWLLGVRRRAAGLVFLASVAGMLAANLLLKDIFHRLRPGESGTPHTFSGYLFSGYLFPSTHTVLTIVTYGLLAYLIGQGLHGRRRTLLVFATVALVAFGSISLVYLDTHYCMDVIGGLLIGGAWLIGSCVILRILETAPQASRIPGEHTANRLHDASEDRTLGTGAATAKREWE